MKPATIYIPFADYHKSIVERAFRSAAEQTIECEIVMALSPDTPAKLRNQAVNAKTPFVCFLDADDTLESTFIEDCLRTYENGRYVYTAWYQGDFVMTPRECNPFLKHNFNDGRGGQAGYHLVTTLFPTEVFKYLGGFDEKLPGLEDVDFYMRAQKTGLCGVLCPKPLVHYNGELETRSKKFKVHPDYKQILDLVERENGGRESMAGCCGINGGGVTVKTNGSQPGDILAEALQPGSQRGRATNRWYERVYPGERIMVHPADLQAMPDVFKEIIDVTKIAPDKQIVLKEAGLL